MGKNDFVSILGILTKLPKAWVGLCQISHTCCEELVIENQNYKGKVQRWKLAIQEFDFDIEFIPGKLNIVADGFSRLVAIDPSDIPVAEECNII